MFKTFLSNTWGQVSVALAALALVAGGISAAEEIEPYLPASHQYVENAFKMALEPIQRSLLSNQIGDIERNTIDLQGQQIQFKGLLDRASTEAERAALQDQLNAIDRQIKDLADARKRALCDLITLSGATNC